MTQTDQMMTKREKLFQGIIVFPRKISYQSNKSSNHHLYLQVLWFFLLFINCSLGNYYNDNDFNSVPLILIFVQLNFLSIEYSEKKCSNGLHKHRIIEQQKQKDNILGFFFLNNRF